ncbi:unnamed protein product [Calypogeia fissa]
MDCTGLRKGAKEDEMEPARLCNIRGNLVLVGPKIDAIARASMPHTSMIRTPSDDPCLVIVATDAELRQSSKKFDELSLCAVDHDSIVDLGLVGSQDDFYFKAIFWKEGIEFRRTLGLPFKQLHVALTGTDNSISEVIWRPVTEDLNLDVENSKSSVDKDYQVSLLVDYCKFLAQDPSLRTTTGPEIVAVLHHLSSIPQFRNRDPALLDLLAVVLYKTKDLKGCMATSKELMSLFPNDPRGYFRCASCYFHIGKSSLREGHGAVPAYCWKLAMMFYAETVNHALFGTEEEQDQPHGQCSFADKLVPQACQAILHCAKYTEFGCLMTGTEAEVFPEEYLHLTLPWNPGVRNAVLQAFTERGEPNSPNQLLSMESRERLCIYDTESKQFLKLPRFFRWITPFRLAAMSTPKNAEDVGLLAKLGIGTVVTLTKEEELSSTWFEVSAAASHTRTSNVFVPVTNYRAPTLAQIDYFFALIDQSWETNSAVLVHCGGGKGRAGTFVACYLARYGFIGIADQQPKYSATEVIRTVRHMRPGSIETDEQEQFVATFVKELWRRAQTGGKLLLLPEPEPHDGSDGLQIEGRFNPRCKMLVCCGIPGSGKSSVSKSLAAAGWTVASQDETGSRDGCAAVVSNAIRQNKSVIVDRCNPTIRDRKEWIDLAMVSPNEVSCLFFDYDERLCLQRAKLRLDHPTLTSDSHSANAIRSMSKNLKPPSTSEGFGSIVTIRSIPAANKFVQQYSCGKIAKSADLKVSNSSSSSTQTSDQELRLSKFHKFPRTRHLCNFGSATRDDLIMTKAEAAAFFNISTVVDKEGETITITFEEKVDGANLGFSIDPESGHIRAQNRSHFVNSKSHPQFKKLDFWIETHQEDLMRLLRPWNTHCQQDDDTNKGPYVLFGEWLQATHSIQYTKLPDYFLAFDVYDVTEHKFWSRGRFWTAMKSTSIHVVPQIPLSEDAIHEEIFKELMGRQSAFSDGNIEGVYVRRDRGPFLLDRGKVVRSDFISGNAHWSKQVGGPENVVRRF